MKAGVAEGLAVRKGPALANQVKLSFVIFKTRPRCSFLPLLWILPFPFDNLFSNLCICVHEFVCTVCMQLPTKAHKQGLDPLELEVQAV